jgi:chitosanase
LPQAAGGDPGPRDGREGPQTQAAWRAYHLAQERRAPGEAGDGTATANAPLISAGVRALIVRVLNVAEIGRPETDYHSVYRYPDGLKGRRQVTLGRGYTEDGGSLGRVIRAYAARDGAYSARLARYLPRVGTGVLAADEAFIEALGRAGREDPQFHQVQDQVFDEVYWQPALRWFDAHGLTLPLSMLVVADSFLHSGRVFLWLESRFRERAPAHGGQEQAWTAAYVRARRAWLAGHPRPLLRKTVYRCDCYAREIARGNWRLEALPVHMNGVAVC